VKKKRRKGRKQKAKDSFPAKKKKKKEGKRSERNMVGNWDRGKRLGGNQWLRKDYKRVSAKAADRKSWEEEGISLLRENKKKGQHN